MPYVAGGNVSVSVQDEVANKDESCVMMRHHAMSASTYRNEQAQLCQETSHRVIGSKQHTHRNEMEGPQH